MSHLKDADGSILNARRRRRRLSCLWSLSLLCAGSTTATSSAATAFVRPSLTSPPRDKLTRRWMSTPSPHISVALDQPLLPTNTLLFPKGAASAGSAAAKAAAAKTTNVASPLLLFQSLWSIITKYSKKAVVITATALCAAFLASILFRTSGSLATGIQTMFRRLSIQVQTILEGIQAKSIPEAVPMDFDDVATEGWGVCTLQQKQKLGQSSFWKYDFALPNDDMILGLELGQELTMCVLDNDDNVAKGSFYPYVAERIVRPGGFSILVPSYDVEHCVGPDTANFCRVVSDELKVGDEIAIQPGETKLTYRGQYLPVTDMVYVAFGTGIVPVLEQIRTVLPSGSSSVKSVEVAWINDNTDDFDVNSDLLEKEYYRYSSKMAVSCIVEDVGEISMHDSVEINAAIPDFKQGTMAVVAGPAAFCDKTLAFLEDRGYPADTICVL